VHREEIAFVLIRLHLISAQFILILVHKLSASSLFRSSLIVVVLPAWLHHHGR